MSRRLQDLFWDLDLTSTEQLVAQRLAWHAADGDGKCWPGIRTLCDKTGLGERAVQKAIKSLAAAGHVTREEALGLGVIYFVHPRTSCAPSKSRTGVDAQVSQSDKSEHEAPAPAAGVSSDQPPHEARPRIKDAPAPGSPTPAPRAPKQVKKPSNDKHGNDPASAAERVTGERGRRIDHAWTPAAELPEAVAKVVAGWPPGRLDDELTEFRDFWLSDAGQRASKRDWDRTWWNRLRAIIKHDRSQEERNRRHDQSRRQRSDSADRPSGWAARPGMEGAEPAYLDD